MPVMGFMVKTLPAHLMRSVISSWYTESELINLLPFPDEISFSGTNASKEIGRVGRTGSSCRRRQHFAPCDRDRESPFDDSMGTTGYREDNHRQYYSQYSSCFILYI